MPWNASAAYLGAPGPLQAEKKPHLWLRVWNHGSSKDGWLKNPLRSLQAFSYQQFPARRVSQSRRHLRRCPRTKLVAFQKVSGAVETSTGSRKAKSGVRKLRCVQRRSETTACWQRRGAKITSLTEFQSVLFWPAYKHLLFTLNSFFPQRNKTWHVSCRFLTVNAAHPAGKESAPHYSRFSDNHQVI